LNSLWRKTESVEGKWPMVKKIAAGVVVLVILVFGYQWYKGRKEYKFKFEKPEFAEIFRGDLVIPITATGNIEPRSRTDIKSKASGTVAWVGYEPGDRVHKGDLLLKLDPVDEQRAVDANQAEVERAKANLELAKSKVIEAERDWPATVASALSSLESARATLSSASLTFQKQEQIRSGTRISAEQLQPFRISIDEVMPSVNEQSDPLSKRAMQAVREGIREATDAAALVAYGRNVLAKHKGQQSWRNLPLIEYKDGMIKLWQAQANVLGACAQVAKAVNSRIIIDQARQNVILAREQLRRAQVQLDQAKQRLNETEVYAPIDGLVQEVNVREGQIISSGVTTFTGGTKLMVLADVSDLYVAADVDEADIGQVRELVESADNGSTSDRPNNNPAGENIPQGSGSDSDNPPATQNVSDIVADSSQVTITVDAFREETFYGKVARIHPSAKNINNVITYNVQILLTSPNRQKLMLGMHANVEFTAKRRENVLLVDAEAIKVKNEQLGVYIPGENDKPVFVPVKRGATDGTNVELVTDKLQVGQRVFTKLPRDRNNSDKEEDD